MTIQVATGSATSLDAREAAIQATQQALEKLGKKTVAFGLVIASYHFPFQQILSGISSLLGDTPLLGFSTTGEFLPDGIAHRSITITLLSGSEIQARADWWPNQEISGQEIGYKVDQAMHLYQSQGLLLIAADGLSDAGHILCADLPDGDYTLAGCLAAGDIRRAYTSQIGGKKTGRAGLAAGYLTGNFRVGIGHGLGWKPIGAYFHVTGIDGNRITTLDQKPANEVYAHYFGYSAQDWSNSPLSELIRLYPIGIEQDGGTRLQVRSPLCIESDGSLRMNAPVLEGGIGHLMLGGIEDCVEAAAEASHQALSQLGDARPIMGLVLADISVQMLLEAQPGLELVKIQSILGAQIPVIGGYTYGQLARLSASEPELLNQHITVIVIGEPKS